MKFQSTETISRFINDVRKPRNLHTGAKYHIIARANRQESILESDALKELFIEIMLKAKKKYRFSFYNFCIMSTHIHFILEPSTHANLSRIMQWILSVFAVKYNKINRITGHVWYDRFKSIILENIFQYLNTYIYVLNNPVEAGIVASPTEYLYNGVSFIKRGLIDIFKPP